MSARLPVRRGGETVGWTLVDDELAPILGLWKWSLNGSGYAFGSPGFMHRVILGLGKKDPGEVDHADRDRLNNQRANLRFSTRIGNCRNSNRADAVARDKQRVAELWASGHTRPEIAAQIDRSYPFVAKTLKGAPPNGREHPTMIWSKDRISEFFKEFHAEYGRLPVSGDMDGDDGRPWFTVVYRRFDSLKEARAYAGFGEVDLRRSA